jgi:CHAT domain-containing protein
LWSELSEDIIFEVNARFAADSSGHHFYESQFGSALMTSSFRLTMSVAKNKDRDLKWAWRTCDYPASISNIADWTLKYTNLRRVLKFAFDTLEANRHSLIKIPIGTKVGGGRNVQQQPWQDDDRPFDNPYYWAAFSVYGDGECGVYTLVALTCVGLSTI